MDNLIERQGEREDKIADLLEIEAEVKEEGGGQGDVRMKLEELKIDKAAVVMEEAIDENVSGEVNPSEVVPIHVLGLVNTAFHEKDLALGHGATTGVMDDVKKIPKKLDLSKFGNISSHENMRVESPKDQTGKTAPSSAGPRKLDLSKFSNVSSHSAGSSIASSPISSTTSVKSSKLDMSKFGNININPMAQTQSKPISISPQPSDFKKKLEMSGLQGMRVMGGPPPANLFKKNHQQDERHEEKPIQEVAGEATDTDVLPSLTKARAKRTLRPSKIKIQTNEESSLIKETQNKQPLSSGLKTKEASNENSTTPMKSNVPEKMQSIRNTVQLISPTTGQVAKNVLSSIKQKEVILKTDISVNSSSISPYLIMVKGVKKPKVMKVELNKTSLNHQDSFVLYTCKRIFLYNGKHGSVFTKSKAVEVANNMKSEWNAGRGDIIEVNTERLGTRDQREFWDFLGLTPDDVIDDAYIDDALFEEQYNQTLAIYDHRGIKLNNASSIEQSMLDPERSYIIECLNELYVWHGHKSVDTDRSEIISVAESILAKPSSDYFNKAKWVNIEVMIDRAESIPFKAKFNQWKSQLGISNLSPIVQKNIERKPKTGYVTGSDVVGKLEFIDPKEMLDQVKVNSIVNLIDDGSGEVKIWSCDDKSKTLLSDPAVHGLFNSYLSYVILYKRVDKDNMYLIYYWQGSKCRQTEQGVAAMQSIELNKEYGCQIIRETQYRESGHFIKIFSSTHNRGFVSLLHNPIDRNTSDECALIYFFVNESLDLIGHSQELANEMDHLYLTSNSAAAIIFKQNNEDDTIHPLKGTLWIGKNPSIVSRKEDIVGLLNRLYVFDSDISIVNDSNSDPLCLAETKLIKQSIPWLSERDKLLVHKVQAEFLSILSKRHLHVFEINHKSGEARPHYVKNFCAHDFDISKVFLIDAYYAIYVWAGLESNQEDLKKALYAAKSYSDEALLTSDSDRSRNFYRESLIYSGEEPDEFYGLFYDYSMSLIVELNRNSRNTSNMDSNGSGPMSSKDRFKQIRKTKASGIRTSLKELTATNYYTLEELSVSVDKLPNNVDATKKEHFLREEDFDRVFQMSKADFFALPAWRQIEKKKKTLLY